MIIIRLHRIALVVALSAATGALSAAPDLDGAKRLVEQKCSICHGMQGESSSESFPRLGGQHAEYLSKQLRDFKDGRRKGVMERFTKRLRDDLIEGLAKYFSMQKISASPMQDPKLGSVGKYLFENGNRASGVPACAGCHGAKGEGAPKLPRLAGQRALYVATQLKNFRNGTRANDGEIMNSVVVKLTELEVSALAEYISGME